MEDLKKAITSAPVLITLDYSSGRQIFLCVDASSQGGGACLEQVSEDGKRHPVRFESTLWSAAESKWHSTKLECKAVVWALKKFALYLFGTRFIIETDAATLISQLNRSSTDMPGSVMNRWLGTILLWDFEIIHRPGKHNVIADALSRYPQPEGWTPPDLPEDNLEPFMDYMVAKHDEGSVFTITEERILDESFSEYSEEIARFLLSGRKPERLLARRLKQAWIKRARTFFVKGNLLFKKSTPNLAIRRVIDDQAIQRALVWEVHRHLCHKGIQATNAAIQARFWWEGQFQTVKEELKRCGVCAAKQGARLQASLKISNPRTIFERWTVDITYMPVSKYRKEFLCVAREYASGYPEARALRKADSKSVAKFLYEDIICRWGVFLELSVDGGPENKSVVIALAKHYGIHRIQASAYNSKAQGLIERGHRPLIVALAKLGGSWESNLPAVLWSERVSIRQSTGLSPAEMILGVQPILPVELSIQSWQSLPWTAVESRSDLLTLRAKQLEWRGEKLSEALSRSQRMRLNAAERWDFTKGSQEDFAQGDLVLVWDSIREIDKSSARKMRDRWLGPYRIAIVYPGQSYYMLEELDGIPFAHTTHANRLKRFWQHSPDEETQLLEGRLKIIPEDIPIISCQPRPATLHPPAHERVEEGEDNSDLSSEQDMRRTREDRRKEDYKSMIVPPTWVRGASPKVIISKRPHIEQEREEFDFAISDSESTSE